MEQKLPDIRYVKNIVKGIEAWATSPGNTTNVHLTNAHIWGTYKHKCIAVLHHKL